MKKKELIDLHNDLVEAHEERRKLGDFDANSKHVRLLLEGLLQVTEHAIEQETKREKKK
jgi:hypothetical protein